MGRSWCLGPRSSKGAALSVQVYSLVSAAR
jgi:hypothetical protein